MIKTFADPETEALYRTGHSKRLPGSVLRLTTLRLGQLDAAVILDDLRWPRANKLEVFAGDRCAIHINGRWRLRFFFVDGNAFAVEIAEWEQQQP